MNVELLAALEAAVLQCDSEGAAGLLKQHAELRSAIDRPLLKASFGENALYAAVQRSDRKMIEVLLAAGANINQKTDWWAGGFGVLDDCSPELATFLMERGAHLEAHSAARLGMLEQLDHILTRDAASVKARGGDGQTPLHFALNVETAELLLSKGAEINARDVDHESTAAQYMLRVFQQRHYAHDRQIVTRYLLTRGAESDLLMAAALGDMDLVRWHLTQNPDSIRMEVSDKWFPKQNPRAGGTIYLWTFGRMWNAAMIARDFGREDVFQLLLERMPNDLKLSWACELGDERAFNEWLRLHPGVPTILTEQEREKLPQVAQSNNQDALRLMLEAGWPVNTRGEMGATALHWAAFHGNAAMTREILRFHPDLQIRSKEYNSTALDWGLFASENSIARPGADFPATIELLRQAQKTSSQ